MRFILALIALVVIAVVFQPRPNQNLDERKLAEAFSCGYTYGTGDAVRLVSPVLGNRPGIKPPQRCADIEQLAADHGVIRIVPRESKQ